MLEMNKDEDAISANTKGQQMIVCGPNLVYRLFLYSWRAKKDCYI